MNEFYISNGELYHYGTKGHSGRYPWGSGERPRQRLEKAKAKKVRKTFAQKRKEKKEAARKAEEERQIKEAERVRAEYKAQQKHLKETLNKEELLREGKASDILKYESVLTTSELTEAYNRINTRAKLSEISSKEIKTGWQQIDDAMKKVKDVNTWTSTGIDFVQNVQDVMSMLKGEAPKNHKGGKGKGK